jgi:hypothetical protein
MLKYFRGKGYLLTEWLKIVCGISVSLPDVKSYENTE